MRASFQGEHGAFSEAAIKAMLGEAATRVPCPDLAGAFRAVGDGRAEVAVVPIENSLGGSIDETYEQLLRHELVIEAEISIPIRQCLMARPGVGLGELVRVYSHPQGLAQCRRFLEAHAKMALHAVYDTAGAARMVASEEGPIAAIGSAEAASIYGLAVLEAGIQDDPGNTTRFIRVGREKAGPTGRDKTSVMFALKDVPGALFKALAAFALRDINLKKLQSRPSKERAWHYAFYVDFEGHLSEDRVGRALAHLEELSSAMKVLGSYPLNV